MAGMIASGRTAEECLAVMRKTNFFRMAFDFSKGGWGLIRGKKIFALFDELFGEVRFEDLSYPLFIGATDFQTGERIIINSGKISDALRATVSVPLLFEPYFHPELKKWLIDGGISQNFPVDIAFNNYKGSRIFSVDVATSLDGTLDFSKAPRFFRSRIYKTVVMRTLRIFLKNQQASLPKDPREIRIVPDFSKYTAIDVGKMEKFVEEGRRAAEKTIAGL